MNGIERIVMVSQEFTCICGKFKSWIGENQVSKPCPNCGRSYQGKYDKKNYQIIAIELKQNNGT